MNRNISWATGSDSFPNINDKSTSRSLELVISLPQTTQIFSHIAAHTHTRSFSKRSLFRYTISPVASQSEHKRSHQFQCIQPRKCYQLNAREKYCRQHQKPSSICRGDSKKVVICISLTFKVTRTQVAQHDMFNHSSNNCEMFPSLNIPSIP